MRESYGMPVGYVNALDNVYAAVLIIRLPTFGGAMKLPITGDAAKAKRLKLQMNQTEFWGRVNWTQSGASRLESGREIHPALQSLLVLAYGTEDQAEKEFQRLRDWA